ncbi:extracellular solute-binding protein [Paenibacillus alba]|uniref:extracellular solute-binding protein n=1 Tax=Paenibacillus alba TaxID=1197127 RepID=UPI001565DF0C|nr:extracellular solute-binding protein [Paenibacillus alba]NQX68693.1 extracellular solute-binding protein [Paenibacillus alba]
MKMLKKNAAFLMAALLVTTSLAGCGKTNTEKEAVTIAPSAESATSTAKPDESKYKDAIELSLALWDVESGLAKAKDDAIYQYLSKKFNVTFKPVGITWDDYAQKINLWAASDSLPDIFSIDAIGTPTFYNWVNQGIVKPIPKDLTKYPNLSTYLDVKDIRATQINGQYYGIPRRTYSSLDYNANDRVIFYRWDWAQAAGVTKEPETFDEYKDMMVKIVASNPEGKKPVGLTGLAKTAPDVLWTYSNPLASSDGSGADSKWIKEDGKYIPAIFSKTSIPTLKLARDWFASGIIDKDLPLLKGEQHYEKFASGKAASIVVSGGYVNGYKKIEKDRFNKVYPDKKFTDVVKSLKPLVSLDGKRYHPVFKTYWSESYFNAKMDDKKLTRILDLYDYLLSPEGKRLVNYGFENVDYKLDGEKIIPTEPKTVIGEKYPSTLVFNTLATWETPYAMDDANDQSWVNKDLQKDAIAYMKFVKANTKIPDFSPELTLVSTPAKDKFSVINSDLLIKIMAGKEDVEQMFNKEVDAYKGKGLDKVIEEVNAKAQQLGIK